MRKIKEDIDPVLEKLANTAHEVWSGWVSDLIIKHQIYEGAILIPTEKVNRWKELVATSYDDLSEEEKEKDRDEAIKYMNALKE